MNATTPSPEWGTGAHRTTGKLSPVTTCLIADDHPAIVSAVGDALERAGYAVTRTCCGEDAVDAITSERPSVAIVDANMPDLLGTEVARRALRVSPETAVVMYTAYGDQALLVEALDTGVRGFVLKNAPLDELLRAVRLAVAGGTYVDPTVAGAFAGRERAGGPTLTERERDVLRLLSEGHDNEEIGQRLYISPETVRTHLRKAMTKLGASTRTQAVAVALRTEIIR
jgi:DNA-binding NarL/FixJ family response regulator